MTFRTRCLFWLARHVAVPILGKALICPTWRADLLARQISRECAIAEGMRFALQDGEAVECLALRGEAD